MVCKIFNGRRKAALAVFVVGSILGSSYGMDDTSEFFFSEESSLGALSEIITSETWGRFSEFCEGENLDLRIENFIFLNEGFISNDELLHFQGVIQNYNYQKAIEASIKTKYQYDLTKYDEAVARDLLNHRPITLQVQNRFSELQLGTDAEKTAVLKFREILEHLRSHQNIPNLDVHFFDNYIFQKQNKIKDLIDFGNLLQVDEGGLTLAQVGQDMKQFIEAHPSLFVNFKYIDKLVPTEAIKGYLATHFAKMDTEVAVHCPAAKIIWSKAWTLAKKLYERENDETAIKIIYEQVCESYLTQGGCIQGRINRGFVGYVCLLTKCGLK